MQGKDDPPELRGVIPHAINHIFEFVNATKDGGHEFLVRCSYLEIYNEELTDLLGDPKNPPKCEIKEDPQKGFFIMRYFPYTMIIVILLLRRVCEEFIGCHSGKRKGDEHVVRKRYEVTPRGSHLDERGVLAISFDFHYRR
jgi:hypothetical protein